MLFGIGIIVGMIWEQLSGAEGTQEIPDYPDPGVHKFVTAANQMSTERVPVLWDHP